MAYDLRQGINEAAAALNMSPRMLATIISYESGFNPDVWGGAGNQYYGLIQFGPAERQQYGVVVGNPASQLGANGAIVRYFRDRGWRPGMSMLDAYSIVNAGGPGKYNAADAQGTSVYDKVEQQFGQHWQLAGRFLQDGSTATMSAADTRSPRRPADQFWPDSGQAQLAATQGNPNTGGAGGDTGNNVDITGDPAFFDAPPRDDSLGDMFAKTVGDRSTAGMDLSQEGGILGQPVGDLPLIDVQPATPPAAPPTPEIDMSPLAQLFSVKNIGQAPALQSSMPSLGRMRGF